jgi:hypothetical protein
VICLVSASPGALRHMTPEGFLEGLGRALASLAELFPPEDIRVLSDRDDVLALAKGLGIPGLAVAADPGADFPWPPGMKAAYSDLRARGVEAGIMHVEARLLMEDNAAFLRFLEQVRTQPPAPVVGMRQARDHPCQMFSAWRVSDVACLRRDSAGAPGSGEVPLHGGSPPLKAGGPTAWEWPRPLAGRHFIDHAPDQDVRPDAIYAEVFDACGVRLGGVLTEVPAGAGRIRASLGPLPDEAACVFACALLRVTHGAYDMTLPFGDVAELWHLEEASGKIVNEVSGQYIFGRQECPAVFHGKVLLAYFPPGMRLGMLDAPLQEFPLFPLDLFPAGAGRDTGS